MRDLDLGNGLVVPASSLRAATSRSGGPGGQNVNNVETRVTIETVVAELPLPPETREKIAARLSSRINREGVLRVTSQSERSQLGNRDRALARMEELRR
jgi:ribosome-associated protein